MSTMTAPRDMHLEGIAVTAASAIKTVGWRSLAKELQSQGRMVITNHNEPQAVLLSPDEYARLVTELEALRSVQKDPLDELRREFDERLQVLEQRDAGDRLRALMHLPMDLKGKVKAGASY